MTKLTVSAVAGDPPNTFRVTAKGQTAKALLALIDAGDKGTTAQDVAGWAYRFAAYCHDLRRKGLLIETQRESHGHGWHGRHILRTPCRIEGDEIGRAA